MPSSSQSALAARMYSSGSTRPPQRLCVFSRHSTFVRGKWFIASGGRTALRTASRSSVPSARFATVRGEQPPNCAADACS